MSSSRIGILFFLVTSILLADGDVIWVPEHMVSIEYPLLALQSQMVGVVKVSCMLREDGSLTDAKVLSGPLLLGHAVLGRIGEWRFRRVGGSSPPPPAAVTLTFTFRLDGPPVGRTKTKFVYDYPFDVTIVSQRLMPGY
jgi:TonB family protein